MRAYTFMEVLTWLSGVMLTMSFILFAVTTDPWALCPLAIAASILAWVAFLERDRHQALGEVDKRLSGEMKALKDQLTGIALGKSFGGGR